MAVVTSEAGWCASQDAVKGSESEYRYRNSRSYREIPYRIPSFSAARFASALEPDMTESEEEARP